MDPRKPVQKGLIKRPEQNPAVAELLEGLAIQHAIPPEMLPAVAELLQYIQQMDEVAEKRKQIQRR